MRDGDSIRRARVFLCAALCGLAFAPLAQAQSLTPRGDDHRLRSITYDPGRVVNFAVELGYQAMIEFGEGERIENVSIGDSVSWQVTPNRRADILFLKPTQILASTNLIVVTNLRHYAFELAAVEHGAGSAPAIYSLRFRYPEDSAAEAAAAAPVDPLAHVENLDFNYALTGARALLPVRVFNDGASTYFQFRPQTDLPALFIIGGDGREEAVNTQMRGGYVVADRVGDVFVLRYGRLQARVTHGGVTAPAPAAARVGPRGRRT